MIHRPRNHAQGEASHSVRIDAQDVNLEGDLAIPVQAVGTVLFAHGSGSSRTSARNRFVARALRRNGFATLLLDLLTPQEELADSADGHLRFDIDLLAGRLLHAVAYLRADPHTAELPIGLFGASTGAAAALIAAARGDIEISACVSRGGRPDLAGPTLANVRCPTLLIVGGEDAHVLDLNRQAQSRLHAYSELVVIEGATHLFEEAGALEQVARLAGGWFIRWTALKPS